ncbi:DUF3788 family protein [Listeria seeligeri]|uniref:DUF3788 family protein n=1 Tax=Listeria seeligeri TaxID=1640 RepID=UPI0016273692|nr:DUF3788 family protein [Listeria seeligeri]MBC2225356.1 DUF3788 family protein [Listeria seeligeri]
MMNLKKDKHVEPTDENLSIVLGESFPVYKKLVEKLPNYEANLEWRFYKDGGWLAKVTRKKKTLFWGEPNCNYFTIAFHFNEKSSNGVFELDIADKLKQDFLSALSNGRKISTLRINLCSESGLADIYQLIAYKYKAK